MLMKPQQWGLDPGLVAPEWRWFWRPTLKSAGIIWEGGGDPYDYGDRNFTTLKNGPTWEGSEVGKTLVFNEPSRNAETIELTNLGSTFFDGLEQFTYAVYFTFTGTNSADEDTLGLQWSNLQGGDDTNATRLLVRYDSNNNQLDYFTKPSGAGVGLTVSANLEDSLPHAIVFRYDSPNADKSIWLDGINIGSTASQTGALDTAAHSKVPEAFGGHGVTGGFTGDAPRLRGHSWAFHTHAWSDQEIKQWSIDPFGHFRTDDDIAAVFHVAAAVGVNPKGPLGMPLAGPFGGPI